MKIATTTGDFEGYCHTDEERIRELLAVSDVESYALQAIQTPFKPGMH